MNLDVSQIAELLEEGNYYSVFVGLSILCKMSSDEKMEAEHLLLKLLHDPFFNTSIPRQELDEIISLLEERGLSVRKFAPLVHGSAQFPVISTEGKNFQLMEFTSSIGTYDLIPERINTVTSSYLFTQLLSLQTLIQNNLSLQEEPGNDTTILNFGVKLKIRDPLISNKNAPSQIIDNSIQFAALVAFFSAFTKIPSNPGYVYAGAFSIKGNPAKLEDPEKIISLILERRPGVKKIFIPKSSLYSKSELEFFNQNSDRIVQIGDMTELIEKVFDNSIKNLLKFPRNILHELGNDRIITTFLGKKSIEIYHFEHPEFPPFDFRSLDIIVAKSTLGKYNVPELKEIYSTLLPANNQLLLLDGTLPLKLVITYISQATDRPPKIIALKNKTTDNFVIVAASQEDSDLIGKQFEFKLPNK